MNPEQILLQLEQILPQVQKPARYVGGEFNQVVKDWDAAQTRVALAFPDLYDLGMSNLGLAILYDLLNQRSDILAERVYLPWSDFEAGLRAAGVPLYSLESKHPLIDFDILGITLPYETLYTNTLNLLDLAGIPLFAAERAASHPLVIAGGHATYNPEPMHAFIDAFVIGEGEEVILEIVAAQQAWKAAGEPRPALLERLARIPGVYVPALYQPEYWPDGTVKAVQPLCETAAMPVQKRIVARLPPPVTRFLVPYIDTVHNRVPIEIMRGCTRGCRFCHAGMVNRPVRERPVAEIVAAIEEALQQTGYEEVGLLSLSSSDYTQILELVTTIGERFAGRHLSLSVPSLRIETFSVDLMDALRDSKRHGFTLAPEAATERMRQIINKPVSTAQLLETAREIYRRGWTTIKLYFMIGHPQETMEDVQAIADLCKAVLAEGRKTIGGRAKVHAGVSTFVPKPHTPFQWVPCDSLENIQAKQSLLRQALRGKNLKLTWTDPQETMLEAWLSRGDRRMAEVIYQAWRRGARFDAWQEHLNLPAWQGAFAAAGLDPSFYTHRERPIDEVFPWEHISAAMRKKFLTEDYLWSLQGKTRVDCRERCFACGILPTFAELRSLHPGEAWQCPEVKPKARHGHPAEWLPLPAVGVLGSD
jgi:radical SAM family uncharacterized protein